MAKLIVREVKNLVGCDVKYKMQTIRCIYIDEKLITSLDNPHPSKKYLMTEDLLYILCDVIPNSSVFRTYSPERTKENNCYYDLYDLKFSYNGEFGNVELQVSIDNDDKKDEGVLLINSLMYNGVSVWVQTDE